MGYIKNLISYCIMAQKAIPTREFEVGELSDLDGVNSAIYIFEEVEGNSLETYKAFECYKKSKIRNCPKLNAPSSILYVGSSIAGLRKLS